MTMNSSSSSSQPLAGSLAYPAPSGVIVVYNLLFLISIPFLLFMLASAALCNKIRRSATWYSLITSWLIYAVFSVLLIGKQDGDPNGVKFELCVLQSAALYACRFLVTATTLSMSVQLYQAINTALFQTKYRREWVPFLVTFPYFVFTAILIIGVVHGVYQPEVVEPQDTRMFCHFRDGLMALISSVVTLAATALLYWVWGLIIILLYRYWSALQKVDEIKRDGKILPMVKRLSGLIIAGLVPLSLSLTAAIYNGSTNTAFNVNLWSNLIVSATALYMTILFLTSPDNLQLWRDWITPSIPKPNKL